MKLLDRRGRGVQPTAAGDLVIEHCRERWTLDSTLQEKLQDLEGLRRGQLRVALSEGFVEEFIESVLKEFARRFPKVVIKLHMATAAEVVRGVAVDEAHIGVTLYAPSDNRVRILKERPQPIYAVMRPGHPLADVHTQVSLADLAVWPIVLAPFGSGLGTLIENAAMIERIAVEPQMVANSISAVKSLVTINDAVTFLPVCEPRVE